MGLVVPAVLCASRREFDETLARYAALPAVSRIQIDVVDGRFAAPASWPYTAFDEFAAMVAGGETLPHLDRLSYEIDLMCVDMLAAAAQWLALGASRLTLHSINSADIEGTVAALRRQHGDIFSIGLAVHTDTTLEIIERQIRGIEYVQFMGIKKVGRQGQPFAEGVLARIRSFHQKHPELPLQVDGGVTLVNAPKLLALGVSSLVVGSGILRAADPAAAYAAFEKLQSPYAV